MMAEEVEIEVSDCESCNDNNIIEESVQNVKLIQSIAYEQIQAIISVRHEFYISELESTEGIFSTAPTLRYGTYYFQLEDASSLVAGFQVTPKSFRPNI